MKRLAILVGAIALTTTTFAQKATLDNPFSLEGSMDINAGASWAAPTLRARYFVNENIAARVELGLGDGLGTPMSESFEVRGNSTDTNTQVGSVDYKNSAWNAQIGAEYHLAGTDRISPYFMLGINFGGGKSTMETKDAADASTYVTDLAISSEGKMSMIGVGIGAGLDVYIIENLYVGLELGLNFSSYTYKPSTGSVTTGGVTTNTVGAESKASYLNTGAGSAAIRLGWRF